VTGVIHPVFPRGKRALAAVLDKVRLGAAWQIVPPCFFECGAGLFESGGRVPRAALCRPVVDRIEAHAPFPLIDIMRHAGALRDPADLGIAVIDPPAFLVPVRFEQRVRAGMRY
jgi:hypothetical protein